jgi:hypothetical protein
LDEEDCAENLEYIPVLTSAYREVATVTPNENLRREIFCQISAKGLAGDSQ